MDVFGLLASKGKCWGSSRTVGRGKDKDTRIRQGTVNAKITAPDFAAALEKGRKKPALSGRAKNSMETGLPLNQYGWLVHLVAA